MIDNRTDFNDMQITEGRNSVRDQVEAARAINEKPWPQPRPLRDENSKPTEYPVAALGHVLGKAAQAISERVQAPLALSGQSVLGAAALAAQRLYNAPSIILSSGMPCSLYMLTLGDSGDRKSSCDALALAPIYEIEKRAQQQHTKEIEDWRNLPRKDREEVAPPADVTALFSDASYEQIASNLIGGGAPAIGVFSDEGALFFGGHSMKADTRAASIAGYTKMFDCGEVTRHRRTDREGSGTVYNRRVSFHLMVQPIAFRETLSDPLMMGQGFMARFLVAAPESLAGSRFLSQNRARDKAESDPRIGAYWSRIAALMNTRPIIDECGGIVASAMAISDEAEALWLQAYNAAEKEQGIGQDYADIKPFAGRFGEHSRRIATVLTVFDGSREIGAEIMARALELAAYSLSEWRRLTGVSQQDREIDEVEKLLAYLQRRRDMRSTQKIAKSGLKPRAGIRTIRNRVAVLVEHGWARPKSHKLDHAGELIADSVNEFELWGDTDAQ